jgi:hypothetical protein
LFFYLFEETFLYPKTYDRLLIPKRVLHTSGRISKKGAFFALKGLHIPAQGNALGNTLQ